MLPKGSINKKLDVTRLHNNLYNNLLFNSVRCESINEKRRKILKEKTERNLGENFVE